MSSSWVPMFSWAPVPQLLRDWPISMDCNTYVLDPSQGKMYSMIGCDIPEVCSNYNLHTDGKSTNFESSECERSQVDTWIHLAVAQQSQDSGGARWSLLGTVETLG
jgi:hypothetical protein